MKLDEKDLPLSRVGLIFGVLSIPLAFAGHLVSLAVVVGVLAIGFGSWGKWKAEKHLLRYTAVSVARAKRGFRFGLIGTACALVMWVLWASNVLLG
ncbi:MAG TPA: hypothetical protein VKG92_04425 [Flavobacteriales bacterium]|nr:hypothetical protein [Flavobacteriales bacterium]